MGQASINHAPFATNQFGLKVDLGFETRILTVAQFRGESWTRHSDTVERQPFYTEGLIQGFQRAGEQASRRAGEQAVMIGLSQGPKPLGLPDFAAPLIFHGLDQHTLAPLVESEWDFHVDWRPDHKPQQGHWFRAQYGRSTVWQGGTVTSAEELHVVLNYDLKLYRGSVERTVNLTPRR